MNILRCRGILLVGTVTLLATMLPIYQTWAKSGSEDKVLTLSGAKQFKEVPQDKGVSGLWQKLLKLQTTASAIHITAHPDDEQGGVLTYLGRGVGARTALLTLNRGEAGANAIGPELFDGLGLIRTEELLVSDRYYGLDDQYFTTAVDYGFSKSIEEALEKWGKENVLRDVVRVIRINRPLVIISRFHGSKRDGHGNHQTAGVISQEAFRAAGDPSVFPEQISEDGLRPWQPLKMYRGGVRANENWNVRVNAGEFSPWLGESYRQFASIGLSYQRSQNSGRLREIVGPYFQHYGRVHSIVDAPERESSFFDGIDTSISGMFHILRGSPPKGGAQLLSEIDQEVRTAKESFSFYNPSSVVPSLARGLKATREAILALEDHPDAVFLLRIKEKQFMDAINCALGLSFTVVAVPSNTVPSDSLFIPAPTLGILVPGQKFKVEATLANRGNLVIVLSKISIRTPEGWKIQETGDLPTQLDRDDKLMNSFLVTVSENAHVSRRYFHRNSIQQSRYKLRDKQYIHLPSRAPVLVGSATYTVEGVSVEIHATAHSRESNLPFGYVWREVKVAPILAVNVKPAMRIAPLARRNQRIPIQVELINNFDGHLEGELRLSTPSGWKIQPPTRSFGFSQAGQRGYFPFLLLIPRLEKRDYEIRAIAKANGKEYSEGYQVIRRRDLDTNYLYSDAVVTVRGIDVKVAANMKVGYVMGVGDEVPSGIEQLGPSVQLLGEEELAQGDLQQFDAIVVGTRAYAVRNDLITYNQRLLDYAQRGGNLIILYQTQEFIPGKWAPYPADLPRRAEEVSEEDSPVAILAPDHPAFTRPNKITPGDFDNWVEQRGSKFFSEWDPAYTPMIETHDRNQAPQRGGWLTAKYGKGYYSYFAYAFHRQSPYGVPGAYRIFANLLSLGQ